MKKTIQLSFKPLAVAFMALLCLPAHGEDESARTPITTEEARQMYSNINMQRTSVHDPSIVYDEGSGLYYVFGSHVACAKSRDLQSWTWVSVPWGTVDDDGTTLSNVAAADAFHTNQTKEITIGGKKVAFGNFDAAGWNCALPGTGNNGEETAWTVDGNMWAPDVIYNPVMEKWCQYLSLNGPTWNSCIILLTADRIEGPYVYQGPVVYTGFRNDTDERISFHKTDLELVIGPQASLPERYRQDNWGDFWPHAIDPCVFYDEEGQLWMSYGSWSGGIYMLQLDESTGLRDYDVAYPGDYDTRKQNVTSDPYFGKKIAGGWYVSGEGSYIEHIGNYYYLFMSYGGLNPNAGYEMRVFRSDRPDGPYTDTQGTSAIFTNWRLNYGPNSDTRGEKLLGSYNHWGLMSVGECAQGHNSVLAAADGNTYLVYHTKFNDGTFGHQVRVHQLYQNADGWLVAAPFEYNGESVGDGQIATTRTFTDEEMAGTYRFLTHRYQLDHNNYEEMTPVDITLESNGNISGAYNGKWQTYDGNSYITLQVDGTTYKGVVVEQQMEPTTIKAVCFTACAPNGTNVWGYKMEAPYALAYTINNTSALPVKDGQVITRNIDLYGFERDANIGVKWNSDTPDVISHTGRYNPAGLDENLPVRLSLELSCGNYYWTNSYDLSARKETMPSGDWNSQIEAYYGFDMQPFTNAYDKQQEAIFLSEGGNSKPSLEQDSLRTGNVVHQYFGASGNCSYVRLPNPLKGKDLEGMTVSLWIKRTDDIPWDAIWSFYNPVANSRLYLTGNSYIGFNNGSDWFDINHPGTVISDNIPVGQWCHVTLTVSRDNGCTLYINGAQIRDFAYTGACNGRSITEPQEFDHDLVLDFIEACPNFYLGYGSFWGSVDVRMDDLIIYSRELERTDVRALNTMCNRVTDFGPENGGSAVPAIRQDATAPRQIYDLSGRPVNQMRKGIYIINGRKTLHP